jgi:hypothetical protein
MSAGHLRLAMHLLGLAVAAALWLLLPFSPVINGAIAALFWLADGAMAEAVFRQRATMPEKVADLRDRVDNPPS